MSLQLLAKQMEAKGRKGDSMLVHMTPEEVAGLQKLAESAGGSLSVNPETGLVEANFLKRMLPTIVGIGVGIGTGNPFLGAAAGAAVGGYQAKKNDQDVLLGAGLGALGGYGGAGLGAGLTAAGGTAAATGAATGASTAAGAGAAGAGTGATAVGQQVGQQAAQQAVQQTAATTGDAAIAEAVQRQAAEQAVAEQTAAQAAQVTPSPTTQVFDDGTSMQFFDDGSRLVTDSAGGIQATPGTDVVVAKPELTVGERFSQAGRGIGQMGTEEGQAEFAKKFGMKQAMAGAAPAMAPGKLEKPPEEDDEMIVYDYDPGRTGVESTPSGSSAERQYFAGSYSAPRRIRARDYQYADGGAVADSGVAGGMSNASADAMSYLMGDSPVAPGSAAPNASQAGLQYLMGQTSQSPVMQAAVARKAQMGNFVAPERAKSTTATLEGYREIKDGPYKGLYEEEAGKQSFDPTSQKYFRTGNVFEYVPPPPETTTDYGGGAAAGGLVGLAKGGMKSGGFVIPADVVSMIGEGNTDAGYSRIKSIVPGATAIKGKDGGQADTVKTHIEGKQPARVAHGEMYVPPETVKRMGGAKKLYAMMDRVRDQATGSKKQIKPVSLKKALA